MFVRVMVHVGVFVLGYYLGRYVERTHAQMNRDTETVDSDEQ